MSTENAAGGPESVAEAPEAREEHPTVIAALVAAWGELEGIEKSREARVKTKQGPDYTYEYADLGDVIESVRPVLARHQLAAVQNVTIRDETIHAMTIIYHGPSGESIEFGPVSFSARGTPQQAGSAMTYARRYGLLSALGQATVDDDGQLAAQRPQGGGRPAPPPEAPMPKREPRTEQEAAIQTLLADLSRPAREDIKERFVARFDCELRELPEDRHEEALTWVEDLLIAEEEPPDGSGY